MLQLLLTVSPSVFIHRDLSDLMELFNFFNNMIQWFKPSENITAATVWDRCIAIKQHINKSADMRHSSKLHLFGLSLFVNLNALSICLNICTRDINQTISYIICPAKTYLHSGLELGTAPGNWNHGRHLRKNILFCQFTEEAFRSCFYW